MAGEVKKLLRKQVSDFLFINLHGFPQEFLTFFVSIPSVPVTS